MSATVTVRTYGHVGSNDEPAPILGTYYIARVERLDAGDRTIRLDGDDIEIDLRPGDNFRVYGGDSPRPSRQIDVSRQGSRYGSGLTPDVVIDGAHRGGRCGFAPTHWLTDCGSVEVPADIPEELWAIGHPDHNRSAEAWPHAPGGAR